MQLPWIAFSLFHSVFWLLLGITQTIYSIYWSVLMVFGINERDKVLAAIDLGMEFE